MSRVVRKGVPRYGMGASSFQDSAEVFDRALAVSLGSECDAVLSSRSIALTQVGSRGMHVRAGIPQIRAHG